jgi:hypothetical protein
MEKLVPFEPKAVKFVAGHALFSRMEFHARTAVNLLPAVTREPIFNLSVWLIY